MKKSISLALAAACCLGLCGCATSGAGLVWTILLLVAGVLILAFAGLRTYQYMGYRKRRQKAGKRYRPMDLMTYVVFAIGALCLLGGLLVGILGGEKTPKPDKPDPQETDPIVTEEPTDPPIVFAPEKTTLTDPVNWGISWEIYQDGTKVDSYRRSEPICFGEPEDYFALPGITTFRGNNYRNEATYGTAAVSAQTLAEVWSVDTGTLTGGVWSGSGWTGQPLIVEWEESTKAVMNLYPEKKAKADLVEVIYACLDGKIYFLDLADGSATRDPINIGQCFKGAGALDPRGYPIMYVGTGDVNYYGERPQAYIISLIDGSILYRFGQNDALSLRTDNDNWSAFDSSPLVDAKTDTLIWPGENGILYTMKLNTQYDPQAGTVSVAPSEQVVTRYNTVRSSDSKYWLGYEASVSVCEGYLYVSENGGMFYCVDLNTMELVWAQDTMDDSNCSPVFERTGKDSGAIYTAPSLHWTQDDYASGYVNIFKLDAINGQIIWQKSYGVYTVSGVSGGIQSTMLLGREGTSIEGMLFCTISRTPDLYNGVLEALDKETGAPLWSMDMSNYTWSSPVAFYGQDGTGYLAVADSAGSLFLLDGKTGTLLDTIDLGGLVEATPAVFGNRLVVGTREEKIICVEIS